MAITALPVAPSRSDPTNFATRADAYLIALATFTTEANDLQTDVNAKQVTTSAAAVTGTTQAGISTTQAGNSNTSFLNIDTKYLGSKTSDPTLNNQGGALLIGAGYWNSSSSQLRFYTGSGWSTANVTLALTVGKTSDTGSAQLPAGTLAQREAAPPVGSIRYSTTSNYLEIYSGTVWSAVGGGVVASTVVNIPAGNIAATNVQDALNELDAEKAVIPVLQNIRSLNYSLVLSDSGKHILHPSADTTARIFTIPDNASVAFPIGTAVTIVNQNAAGVITISITTDTLRLAGQGTVGSRLLAANGIATVLKITATEWIIAGTGVS